MYSTLLICLIPLTTISSTSTEEKSSQKQSLQTSGFYIQYTEPNLEAPSEMETFSARPREGGAFPPVTVPISDGNGPISDAGSISINGALVLPAGCTSPPPPPRQRVALMNWSETWLDGQHTTHITNHHLEVWANYKHSLRSTAETVCDGYCNPVTATFTRSFASTETVGAAITGSIGIPGLGGSIGFNIAAQSGFTMTEAPGAACPGQEDCDDDCAPDPIIVLAYEREVKFVVLHRVENCVYTAPDDQGSQDLICSPPTNSSSSTGWFALPQTICQQCELAPCTIPCD